MSNTLDRYRKTGEEKATADEDRYVAYGVITPQPRRLAIRRLKEAHRAPGYGYLIDLMWDGDQGREIALIYSHAVIMIKGRNLRELAEQLVMEKIGWIQEFDAKRWARPAEGEPVIEAIEYTTRVLSPLSQEGKDSGKEKSK